MANKHETLSDLFTATADAIREKTGSMEPIVADEFPTKIAEISTGSTNYGNGVGQISTYELLMVGGFSPTYTRRQ